MMSEEKIQYFDFLAKHSTEIVIFLSQDLKILNCNQAALQYFGTRSTNVIDKSLPELCRKQRLTVPIPKDADNTYIKNLNFKFETTWSQNKSDNIIAWRGIFLEGNVKSSQQASLLLFGINNTAYIEKCEEYDNLENILAAAPVPLYWKDLHFYYKGYNHRFADLINLPHAENLLGKSDYDLPWSSSAADFKKDDEHVIKDDLQSHSIETTITLPSGQTKIYQQEKSVLKDKNNMPIGIIGVVNDITEQKEKEAALKKAAFEAEIHHTTSASFIEKISRQLMRGMVTDTSRYNTTELLAFLEGIIVNMPGNVYWKDHNSVYLGCNKQLAKVVNIHSPADIVGKTDEDLAAELGWAPGIAEQFKRDDQVVMLTKEANTSEDIFTQADGKQVTMLTTKTPIFNDRNDVIGILAVSQDITERKQQEEQAKVANLSFIDKISRQLVGDLQSIDSRNYMKVLAFLEGIIANMPGNVYWKNQDSVYLGCNLQLAKIANITSPAEIVGKTDEYFAKVLNWSTGLAEQFKKDDQEVMRAKEAKTFEDVFVQADGKQVTMLTTKTPILNENGDVLGIIAVSQDITERKLQEAQLKKAKEDAESANLLKTQFLGIISHELRTPLNAILGLSQILINSLSTPVEREKAEYINQSGEYLLELVNQILDFSQMKHQSFVIRKVEFDINTILEQVINKMQYEIGKKDIKLLYTLNPSLHRYLKGDAQRIKQILINLINNAVKFTERGVIKIDIDFQKIDDKTITLLCSVSDTGIGIAQDKLQIIFEHFVQVDSKYTRRYSGVGLGLAICKQLLELMDGKITVESQIGSGSTFRFTLPIEIVTKGKKFSQSTKKDDIDSSLLNYHVLVVEDNKLNYIVLKSMLDDFGCVVEWSDNGKDVFELVKNNYYDIVLMDISLPDIDGITLAKNIRNIGISSSHLPIIAVTAHVFDDDNRIFLESGMNCVLTKPIDKLKLKRILIQYCSGNRAVKH